jgi:hypothetical protein
MVNLDYIAGKVITCFIKVFELGANAIKKCWHNLTYLFCKLEHFSALK